MSNLVFPKFATPSRTGSTVGGKGIILTQEEIDAASKELALCSTQFQRVRVLFQRGWSTSQTEKILTHEDGTPMRPQMINKYRDLIRRGFTNTTGSGNSGNRGSNSVDKTMHHGKKITELDYRFPKESAAHEALVNAAVTSGLVKNPNKNKKSD